MKLRKIISPILVVAGVVLFIFGSYISSQVNQGQEKINRAQKGVNAACSIIKVNPNVEKIGKTVGTKPIQQKINEGQEQADSYKKLAFTFKVGGVSLFVLGLIGFFVARNKNA